MQATGGRSVLILGIQGRGGGGMEIGEQAKARAVVSPWSASASSRLFVANPCTTLFFCVS